jgi:hypothetical protein
LKAILRKEKYSSTYSGSYVLTSDGFSTYERITVGSNFTSYLSFRNKATPDATTNTFYNFGDPSFSTSWSGPVTAITASAAEPFDFVTSNHSLRGAISTNTSGADMVFAIKEDSPQKLYKTTHNSTSSITVSDLTANLLTYTPAAVEVFDDGTGEEVFLLTNNGKILRSIDGGSTFTLSSTKSNVTVAPYGAFVTKWSDRNVVVFSQGKGRSPNIFYGVKNSGGTWGVHLASCNVDEISIADLPSLGVTRVYYSCLNGSGSGYFDFN